MNPIEYVKEAVNSYFAIRDGRFGDITRGRAEAIARAEAGKGIVLSQFRVSPFLIANSRVLTLPALFDALEGDPRARSFYEDNRYFAYSALPEWARFEVRSMLERGAKRIKLADLSASGLGSAMRLIAGDAPILKAVSEKSLIEDFNLDAMITYSVGKLFSDRAQARTYSRSHDGQFNQTSLANLNLSDALSSRFRPAFTLSYHPMAHGPVGEYAREAFKRALSYMLAVNIAMDLEIGLRVVLTPANLKTLVNAHSPWKTLESRPAQNLLNVTRTLRLEFESLGDLEHDRLVNEFMGKAQALGRLRRALSPSPGTERKAEPDTGQLIGREEPVSESAGERRARFLAGTFAALSAYQKHVGEPQAWARRLHKISTIGGPSYVDVIEKIEQGVHPEKIVSEYLAKHRVLPEAAPGSSAEPQAKVGTPKDTGCSGEEVEPLRVSYLLLNGRSPFKEWWSAQDDMVRAQISERLQRVALGIRGGLGSYGGGKHRGVAFIEFKCRNPSLYRVYAVPAGRDCFTIVWAGHKSTQRADLDKFVEFVRKGDGVTAERPEIARD